MPSTPPQWNHGWVRFFVEGKALHTFPGEQSPHLHNLSHEHKGLRCLQADGTATESGEGLKGLE